MEIIALIVFITIGIHIEVYLYKKKILPHIVYDCYFSKDEVVEGESLEIIETVMNPSPLFIPCLKSEIVTSKYLEFAGNVSTVNDQTCSLASLFAIKSKQKIKRTWKIRCLQRGVFKLEDTMIVGTDLFGIYQYSDMLKQNSKLVVLPRPIDVSGYMEYMSEAQGDQVVKRFILEDPFEIAGVREYNMSDSMNKIHWGITAKQGQIMVRNNEATVKRSLTLIVNNQLYSDQLKEPMHDERLEYAIRIAAGELDKTISTSTPVRLLANGGVNDSNESLVTRQMWGQAHVYELFVLLASLKPTYTEHFDKFLKRYEHSIETTEVIIVTCYIDEPILEFVRAKQSMGIHAKIYLLSYEVDSKKYKDIEIYYLLDYLKEVGER